MGRMQYSGGQRRLGTRRLRPRKTEGNGSSDLLWGGGLVPSFAEGKRPKGSRQGRCRDEGGLTVSGLKKKGYGGVRKRLYRAEASSEEMRGEGGGGGAGDKGTWKEITDTYLEKKNASRSLEKG